MAGFFVIFNAAPTDSSDAAFNTAPIASTLICAPRQTAQIAYVEAADVAHAQEAVEAAYHPSTGLAQNPIKEAGAFTGKAFATVAKASWKES